MSGSKSTRHKRSRSRGEPGSLAELRAAAMELYARIIDSDLPPRHVAGYFQRVRPGMAWKARRFVSSVAWSMLRWRARLLLQVRHAAGGGPDWLPAASEAACAVFRNFAEGKFAVPTAEAAQIAHEALQLWVSRGPAEDNARLPNLEETARDLDEFVARFGADPDLKGAKPLVQRSAKVSLPPTLLGRWEARFGAERAAALAESFLIPAALHVRVNTLKITRDEYLAKFEGTSPCKLSPDGVVVGEQHEAFRKSLDEGLAEVQDEGSQLVAYALMEESDAPRRILDACAGGGGKALHLAALCGGRGVVFAHDLSAERMEPLRERADRAGAAVQLIAPGTAAEHGSYDAVLIDAPCMGLGRLRREPFIALREDFEQQLATMNEAQRACLRDYAPLVKPGGLLVYATCSFEPEETSEMLAGLEGFRPDPLPVGVFGKLAIEANISQVVLLPSEHGTDGFFIARMRRI